MSILLRNQKSVVPIIESLNDFYQTSRMFFLDEFLKRGDYTKKTLFLSESLECRGDFTIFILKSTGIKWGLSFTQKREFGKSY